MQEPLDKRWPQLLAAARAWRASIIGDTITTPRATHDALIVAIEAFDSEQEQAEGDAGQPKSK